MLNFLFVVTSGLQDDGIVKLGSCLLKKHMAQLSYLWQMYRLRTKDDTCKATNNHQSMGFRWPLYQGSKTNRTTFSVLIYIYVMKRFGGKVQVGVVMWHHNVVWCDIKWTIWGINRTLNLVTWTSVWLDLNSHNDMYLIWIVLYTWHTLHSASRASMVVSPGWMIANTGRSSGKETQDGVR